MKVIASKLFSAVFLYAVIASTPINAADSAFVIEEGIGVSFSASKDEIEQLGFKQMTFENKLHPNEPTVIWGLVNFDESEYWEQKSVSFTSAGLIYQIKGSKVFLKRDGGHESCIDNLYWLQSVIDERYPSLHHWGDRRAINRSEGFSVTQCEDRRPIKEERTPDTRCIDLTCEPVPSRPGNYSLEIEFYDIGRLRQHHSTTSGQRSLNNLIRRGFEEGDL